MNISLNKVLLARDIFISELHLREPGFLYGGFEPFTKNHGRIKKLTETDNVKHIYKNKLGQTYFALDTTYADSKDLAKIFFR